MQVTDTASINMTMLGTGSQSDPWLVSADFAGSLDDLLDVDTSGGTTGQVLARQADGTYALAAPSVAAVGAVSTGTSIEGDGSGGDPLQVRLAANSGLELTGSGVRTVPYTVTEEADLDSLYGSLPAGSVVADTDGSGYWVKTLSGWTSLIEDTGTLTTIPGNITAGSGWTINSFQGRRRNGIVQLRVIATRSSNTLGVDSDGNVNGSLIGTIANPLLRPVFHIDTPGGFNESVMALGLLHPSGALWLEQIAPNVTAVAGTPLHFTTTFIGV